MPNNNTHPSNTHLKTIALMTTIIIAITSFSWAIYSNKLDKNVFELQKNQIEHRLDKIDHNLDKIFNHMISDNKKK